MQRAMLVTAMLVAGLVGAGRADTKLDAAIAAADKEFMAQESGARGLDSSYAELDKSPGPAKYELSPRFIKYKGMKCLVEDQLPRAVAKRSLKQLRRSTSASAEAAAAAASTETAAAETAGSPFSVESLISTISSSGKPAFGGISLENFELGLGSLGPKGKGKGKQSLARFNFMKKILELIGLFVKVATDEKFLKDGNFLDFIKLCRETLLGFDKQDR